MKPDFLDNRNVLEECPKCGNYALARLELDKCQCLCCRFHQDAPQSEGEGMLFLVAILAFVVLGLLSNQNSPQVPKLNPNSAQVSFLGIPLQKL